VKRIRGDEPIGVVIHRCMEISHGNSLCSYPYLKLAKMSCFSFTFFLLQYWRIGGQKKYWAGVAPLGGKWQGKG
jgi:hypothetical protein